MKATISIKVYNEVLEGKRKRFPSGFWQTIDSKNYIGASEITKYLIEDILKLDDEQIKKDLNYQVFFDNKLKGMMNALFDDSVFKALDNAYPGRFKEWELACNPRNFWNMENAKKATIWLFKEKLKWSSEEILQRACKKTFIENGLYSMLHIVFHKNVSLALKNAFPELF